MVTCLAHCLDQELWKAIEYLKEQIRVLKKQRDKDKCILQRGTNGLTFWTYVSPPIVGPELGSRKRWSMGVRNQNREIPYGASIVRA